MLLLDVKFYMTSRGRASLQDLAAHFTVTPDAMRGLMDTWIVKGRARRVGENQPCGSCGMCDSTPDEIFEWIDTARPMRRACGH